MVLYHKPQTAGLVAVVVGGDTKAAGARAVYKQQRERGSVREKS
jgi:hypothetical protein